MEAGAGINHIADARFANRVGDWSSGPVASSNWHSLFSAMSGAGIPYSRLSRQL